MQPRIALAFYTISFLSGEGTSLAHVPLSVYQDVYILVSKAAFQLCSTKQLLMPGAFPAHMQDFTLLLAELHEMLFSTFIQTVEVPLDGSMTPWCIFHSPKAHFCLQLPNGRLWTM